MSNLISAYVHPLRHEAYHRTGAFDFDNVQHLNDGDLDSDALQRNSATSIQSSGRRLPPPPQLQSSSPPLCSTHIFELLDSDSCDNPGDSTPTELNIINALVHPIEIDLLCRMSPPLPPPPPPVNRVGMRPALSSELAIGDLIYLPVSGYWYDSAGTHFLIANRHLFSSDRQIALVSSAGIPRRQRSPHIDIVHLYKARGIENRHSAPR